MSGGYTPGPWRYDNDGRSAHVWGPTVSIRCGSNLDHFGPDMRLIAAAPELLEALELYSGDGALQTFEDRERFRAVARAAIAKARGAP